MSWFSNAPRTFVEPAQSQDVAAIADIHARSFTTGWSAEEFAAFASDQRVTALVLRHRRQLGGQEVVGFIVCRTVAGEAEILTVAVDPRQRRRGYGRLLIETALRRVYQEGAGALFLEVDETNAAAIKLYRALGFAQVGERKAYYADGNGRRTSALVMRVQLR
ncbi:MAG: ribosomal protein S18-alanine N-acetyltransferase [Bauldia sp.]